MFTYLGKYGNHHVSIPIFIHTRAHMNVTFFWLLHDYIVNIVSCLGAMLITEHMATARSCFNAHSLCALLMLELSQPEAWKWGGKVLINGEPAISQRLPLSFASCICQLSE